MGSGRTDLFFIAVCAISGVAALTDLARGRIYNWLTVPAFLAGLAYSGYEGGLEGVVFAALGAFLGLVLYGWMFFIGHLGGGDVKLLMALGAWGGPAYCLETGLLGVLLGGVMAACVLGAKGRLIPFFRKLQNFLLSVLVKELEVDAPKFDRKQSMPFGVPIGIAAIWTAAAHPLQKLGLLGGGWPW